VAEKAEPPGVVTRSNPLLTPLGMVVEMLVLPVTVYASAPPLTVTAVAPTKFLPVIVKPVPGRPMFGDMDVTEGGTKKLVGLV
jgi:hypothetical protein